MAHTSAPVEYYYVNGCDELEAAYRVLSQLAERGVKLDSLCQLDLLLCRQQRVARHLVEEELQRIRGRGRKLLGSAGASSSVRRRNR